MDSDKLLRDIGLDLDTFQAHIKRMRKHGKLHKLDVDLLQEKTKKLYDRLFILEESLSPKEIVVEKKVETPTESAPIVEKPILEKPKTPVPVMKEIVREPVADKIEPEKKVQSFATTK